MIEGGFFNVEYRSSFRWNTSVKEEATGIVAFALGILPSKPDFSFDYSCFEGIKNSLVQRETSNQIAIRDLQRSTCSTKGLQECNGECTPVIELDGFLRLIASRQKDVRPHPAIVEAWWDRDCTTAMGLTPKVLIKIRRDGSVDVDFANAAGGVYTASS